MPIEPFDKRRSRFLAGGYSEIAGTTLLHIQNFTLPELTRASEMKLDGLIFLGTHAIIQTVTEKLLGYREREGTRFYLERFVDHPATGRKYSDISDEIHEWRNSVAHMPFSTHGYRRAIDYTTPEGWKRNGKTIHFNPVRYVEDFCFAYGGDARIFQFFENDVRPEVARLQTLVYVADFLDLPKGDPVRTRLKAFRAASDDNTRDRLEREIRDLLDADAEREGHHDPDRRPVPP